MNASEDLCAYPDCEAEEGSLVHWCRRSHNHPPTLLCHPFKSALETAETVSDGTGGSPPASTYNGPSASNRADILLPLWVMPALIERNGKE